MNLDKNTPRFLGAAFLFQAIAAIVWFYLLSSLTVVGDISATMTNISNNVLQMRASIVIALLTAIGVAVLGALLYIVLHKQNKIIALVALALYLIEAAILAASRIEAFSLLRISQESVVAGHPAYLQTLGNLFYESADFGDWLHLLPFAIGAILFYYLFFQSRTIPRALSLFGLTAASLALTGTSLVLLGFDFPIVIVGLNFLFEITIGVWLLVKGISSTPAEPTKGS
jgi:hypothetical protein